MGVAAACGQQHVGFARLRCVDELQIRELRNEVAALEGKRELNAETMFAKLFPMLEGYVPACPMHNMHRLSPWSALAHWYRLEAAEAEIHRLDLVLHAATAPVRVATFTLRYQSSAALHAHHAFVWTGRTPQRMRGNGNKRYAKDQIQVSLLANAQLVFTTTSSSALGMHRSGCWGRQILVRLTTTAPSQKFCNTSWRMKAGALKSW